VPTNDLTTSRIFAAKATALRVRAADAMEPLAAAYRRRAAAYELLAAVYAPRPEPRMVAA